MAKRPPKKGNKEENILVVDGDSLFKTGYYGAKSEFNDKGEHIGGIYQFLTVIRKFLNEGIYHKVVVFWDGLYSGKLRYNIYKDYKSNRNKDYINGTMPEDKSLVLQRYKVREYCEELFIRQFEDDIVESDDFISYICKTKNVNQTITILSNDADLTQLIGDKIRIYLLDKKKIVDKSNFKGFYEHIIDNTCLIKVICGDNSDAIKGIKGVSKPTLLKYFPEIKDVPLTVDNIVEKAKLLQENRVNNKKKPLKSLNNIINKVTDGIQGTKIYEINEKLVNLDVPLLTESSLPKVKSVINDPIDVDGRSIKNVYNLIIRDGMNNLIKDENFANYFTPFKRLIEREKVLTKKKVKINGKK